MAKTIPMRYYKDLVSALTSLNVRNLPAATADDPHPVLTYTQSLIERLKLTHQPHTLPKDERIISTSFMRHLPELNKTLDRLFTPAIYQPLAVRVRFRLTNQGHHLPTTHQVDKELILRAINDTISTLIHRAETEKRLDAIYRMDDQP